MCIPSRKHIIAHIVQHKAVKRHAVENIISGSHLDLMQLAAVRIGITRYQSQTGDPIYYVFKSVQVTRNSSALADTQHATKLEANVPLLPLAYTSALEMIVPAGRGASGS